MHTYMIATSVKYDYFQSIDPSICSMWFAFNAPSFLCVGHVRTWMAMPGHEYTCPGECQSVLDTVEVCSGSCCAVMVVRDVVEAKNTLLDVYYYQYKRKLWSLKEIIVGVIIYYRNVYASCSLVLPGQMRLRLCTKTSWSILNFNITIICIV